MCVLGNRYQGMGSFLLKLKMGGTADNDGPPEVQVRRE